MQSATSWQGPAHGNRHTIGKREHLHGVFRSSAKISLYAKFFCEHWPGPLSVWTGPPAGRPTVAGCALPGAAKNQKRYCVWCRLLTSSGLAVRQHLVNIARVGRMNFLQFFQAAHTVRLLRAEQVSLAGVHPHHFSRRSNLKALRGAAMRLELQLLYLLFCHRRFLSKSFP